MATFKCKMCGGELELEKGVNIAECSYCGTKQTVPNFDNDKILRLYDRANQYRLDNEFDKAYSAYETIISEKEDEAEAYWGLVLAEYGVEYVEDPATKKRVHTCHRTRIKSVTSNENYKLACKFADSESKMMYEDEAEKLDSLQKKILNISAKEDPYDVFICYKETDDNGERTADSVLAQDIYNELTRIGLRVFFSRISLEDKLGKDYEPCIYAALTSAKVMLMVTTDSDHCNAVWVKNEWKRYIDFMQTDKDKVLIPVYKDISPYTLPDEFAKLQAQDMSKLGAVQDLVRGVEKLVGKDEKSQGSFGKREKYLLEKLEKSEKRRKVLVKSGILFLAAIILSFLFSSIEFFRYLPLFTYNGISISIDTISSVLGLGGMQGSTKVWIPANQNNGIVYASRGVFLLPLLVSGTLALGVLFNWIHGLKSKGAMITYLSLFSVFSIGIFAANFLGVKLTLFSWCVFALVTLITILSVLIRHWKNKKKLISIFIVIIILLVAVLSCVFIKSGQGVKRDESRDQIVVKVENLNFRSNPDKNSQRLAVFQEGEIFNVLGVECDSEYIWYKVETRNKTIGYVSSGSLHEYVEYLHKDGGVQSNDRDEKIAQISINTEYINIREKSSLKSSIVGKVYKDEVYDVKSIQYKNEYVWYEITTSFGTDGFVAKTRNSDSIIEFLPEGVTLSQSNKRDASVLQVKVKEEYLNLREKPDEGSKSLACVGKGDVFSVQEVVYLHPHTWYKIKTNQGVEGYIASGHLHKYLDYIASNSEASEQSNKRDASKEQIEINTDVYLYESASEDSKVIGLLYRGEVYDVLQKKDDAEAYMSWCKIKTNWGVTGYVKCFYNTDQNGSLVPF